MKLLLPINIDKWRSPIAAVLRACVEHNPNIDFVTFSKPETPEDLIHGEKFWNLPNVIKGNCFSLFFHRFDIVHIASHTNRNLVAGTLAKIFSLGATKFLYTINLELPSSAKNTFIYRWFNAVVDYYVSVSKAASTLVLQDAPDSYLGTIPNGFDVDFFDPFSEGSGELPDAIKALNGSPYILNVAALEPRKHPEWIVKLAERNPEMTFVMAGWIVPRLGEEFHQQIMACSLPNLIWLGHVNRDTICTLLRHASVFAFPSDREGLPLSVIEAMGMGLPVIAQPKSSLPELIVDGINGRLIDIDHDDSCEQWSRSLEGYLNLSHDEIAEMKSRLRAYAVSKYSWESIGKAYGKLYHSLASRASV
jgi:glycosyltransferase involved in cell wall biosynthesis